MGCNIEKSVLRSFYSGSFFAFFIRSSISRLFLSWRRNISTTAALSAPKGFFFGGAAAGMSASATLLFSGAGSAGRFFFVVDGVGKPSDKIVYVEILHFKSSKLRKIFKKCID